MSKRAAADRFKSTGLSGQHLDNVVGGTVTKVDHASAKLLLACTTGEHIKTASF
jgi:type VI protein secretion system component Hcp